MLKWIAGIFTAVITAVLTAWAAGLIQKIDPWHLIKMPTIGLPSLDVACSSDPATINFPLELLASTVTVVVTAESAPVQKANIRIRASKGFFYNDTSSIVSHTSIETGETDTRGIMRIRWGGDGYYYDKIRFYVDANKKEYGSGDAECGVEFRYRR